MDSIGRLCFGLGNEGVKLVRRDMNRPAKAAQAALHSRPPL